MASNENLRKFRSVINENLRVQRGGAEPVPYIDVGSVLSDVSSRQNHAIFARRGCGKTLLLHHSSRDLDPSIRTVYLNCEDFKRHSFPNVLIEILDALFGELDRNLTGWFGRKKRSRELIGSIRHELDALREKADSQEEDVRERSMRERSAKAGGDAGLSSGGTSLRIGAEMTEGEQAEIERTYRLMNDKIRDLDIQLPKVKRKIRELFKKSISVKAVYLQVDDFYHLTRVDQPLVMDYIHRLCKDLPLYFKIATLKHATALYADRGGQPLGAQERHDYQPINIDFTFSEFKKTREQNRRILHEFGRLAGIAPEDVDDLFKGEGFDRLVLAGGGVPRDCLSLFLEVLEVAQTSSGDKRIGKDDVRILSRANFERRIEELKQDADRSEQDTLIRGIYVLRKFCIDKGHNVFMVSEQMMQQEDHIRGLIYRLLDYRIVHSCGTALTHKSQTGTFQAFAVDIGCYAHLRKLHGRFTELDLSASGAKEQMRSTPVLDAKLFDDLWRTAPERPEDALRSDDTAS